MDSKPLARAPEVTPPPPPTPKEISYQDIASGKARTPTGAIGELPSLGSFEEEVAWVAQRVFQTIATFRREPHWLLPDHEAKDLARSFCRAVTVSLPKAAAKAIEGFFGKWGPLVGLVLTVQMIVEPRVETSRLLKAGKPQLHAVRPQPARTAPAAAPISPLRVAEPAAPPPPPPPPTSAEPSSAEAIPVPEVRPGSFKDQIDGSPVGVTEELPSGGDKYNVTEVVS